MLRKALRILPQGVRISANGLVLNLRAGRGGLGLNGVTKERTMKPFILAAHADQFARIRELLPEDLLDVTGGFCCDSYAPTGGHPQSGVAVIPGIGTIQTPIRPGGSVGQDCPC